MNIIHEIHTSFSQAEQELINEARGILKEHESEEVQKRSQALRDLGFIRSSSVKSLSKEEIDRARFLTHWIEKYQKLAPHYKFITEEKLDEINEKYGLVFGHANIYTGPIPTRNQEEIIDFDFIDRKIYESKYNPLGHVEWRTANERRVKVRDMDDSHIENVYRLMRAERIHGNNVLGLIAMFYEQVARGADPEDLKHPNECIRNLHTFYPHVVDSYLPVGEFYISADPQSMDMELVELVGNRAVPKELLDAAGEVQRMEERELLRVYDPIVLKKVLGGWLIVTAWGDEASDVEVHNPNLN